MVKGGIPASKAQGKGLSKHKDQESPTGQSSPTNPQPSKPPNGSSPPVPAVPQTLPPTPPTQSPESTTLPSPTFQDTTSPATHSPPLSISGATGTVVVFPLPAVAPSPTLPSLAASPSPTLSSQTETASGPQGSFSSFAFFTSNTLRSNTTSTTTSSNADLTPFTIADGTGFTAPNSNPSNTASPAGASSKVNGGAIAGGILGALVLLVLVSFAVVLVRRRRRQNKRPPADFLNRTFLASSSLAENSVAYPFSSDDAAHNRSSTVETTIGRGFTFPPRNT